MKINRLLAVLWLGMTGVAWGQGVGASAPGYGYLTLQNAAGGTVLNGPAKTAPGNQVVQTSAGDTDALGICVYNCGTVGPALIALAGPVMCVFDGSVAANDWVQISATSNGKCHDAGATRPTHSKLLGVAQTTATGPGIYAIVMSDVAAIGAVQTDVASGLIDISLMPAGVIAFPSGAIVLSQAATCFSGFTKVTLLGPKPTGVIFCKKN